MHQLTCHYINNSALQRQARAIREEVFIQEQHVPPEDEYDQFEVESHHFIALDGEYPCGTARWRITSEGVKLERFAVRKPYRGKGVGSLLVVTVLKHIAERAEAAGKKLYLNAQLGALPLYTKFGFRPEGERFMECNIEHQKMVR